MTNILCTQAILFAETSNEVILGMYIVPTVSATSEKPGIRDVDMASASLVRSLAPTSASILALINVKALSGALSPTTTLPWCLVSSPYCLVIMR